MAQKYKILSINPGSTSTKIAVYENEDCLADLVIRHSKEELAEFANPDGDVFCQKDMRKKLVYALLKENNIDLASIDAVVGRAGRLPPLSSGTYTANNDLLKDVPSPLVHAALLGAVIAKEIADEYNIPGYFVDPTVVDELIDITRLTGIPEIKRQSIFHALNHKAVARRYAKENNVKYDSTNLIVAHMGGGISLGAHKQGQVVEITNPSNGEGPIGPERAGAVPAIPLIDLCFSNKYSQIELKSFFTKKGGLMSLCGTSDFREIEAKYVAGDDPEIELIFNAFCYRIAKEICAMSAILEGKVDAIILTGGLAYSKKLVEQIVKYTQHIGKIVVYPGEDEMLALTQGALRVLNNEEKALEYQTKGPIGY